jgi:hypothetical protein
MTPELLFSHVGTAAMAGWALLILGPRRYAWFNAIPLWIIPAGLSAVYAALIFSRFSGMGGGFDSLDSVATLMSDRLGAAGGLGALPGLRPVRRRGHGRADGPRRRRPPRAGADPCRPSCLARSAS